MRTAFRIAALMLLAVPLAVHAAITCSVTSPGFNTAYSPASGSTNITQTFVTVSCTRGSSGDPSSVTYTIQADSGLFGNGINNRAAFGASRISYDVFKDAACATQWKNASTIPGTITFSSTGTVTQQANYWGCVTAAQSVPAGTYTDTVTITLNYGTPQSTATGSFGVSISTPASCNLTTAPGPIVFNYTALGGAVNANTSYGVTCTMSLPYSVALDATTGTVLGLTYTLALGTASSVGTGSEQTQTIAGSIAGGQAGTCTTAACSASQSRTLTISY